MLPTFVIGLREGMEAALIVGIVAAFLGQQGRQSALRQVWIGVAVAVVICIGVGVALQIISDDLPQRQQEGLETVVGPDRRRDGHLHGPLDAPALPGPQARPGAAGPVGPGHRARRRRWSPWPSSPCCAKDSRRSSSCWPPSTPAATPRSAGWARSSASSLAVVLGYLIYKGGVRINLSRFFRITGIVLVVIAAGLVMTAVHTANEAGWINFGQTQAFDLSWLVRPGTPLESFVTGVLGIQPYPVWIEVIAYLAYLVPMLVVMCWPARRRSPSASPPRRARRRDDPGPASADPQHRRHVRSTHPAHHNQPMKEHYPVASTSSRRPPRPAGITSQRDVPARWVGPSCPPTRDPGRHARWPRDGRRHADGAGGTGRRGGQGDHVNDQPHPERLRAQAGEGDDRSDPVQRAEQERRGRLRGRAADQGPVPHPRRAGEPHPGPLRRVRPRRAARALRHQLPRCLPAARHLHRDRQGQGGLRPDQVAAAPPLPRATPPTSTSRWPAWCPPPRPSAPPSTRAT